jgi:inner membrane protein
MEPVTHLLTGACLSRTGLNRRAAYATLTMVVAAEFPDIDTLWSFRGPIEGFQHHRGITHTFLGLPFEAALIVAAVYGLHRCRVRRARATVPVSKARPLTVAPVRWGVLYGLALVALLSHLLLDYTNNYGLRPFFPFSGHWYAASIVFIFDPWMFAMLFGALVAPALFGLVSAEVGARKQPFRGRGWAIAALVGIIAWWGLRTAEHERALQMATSQSITMPVASAATIPVPQSAVSTQAESPNSSSTTVAPAEPPSTYLPVQRALASPDPLNPFRWSAAMDFGPVYQLAEIDTRGGTVSLGETTYAKPARSAEVLAAQGSKLGRAYMDWSPMPIIEVAKSDTGLATDPSAGSRKIVNIVTLRDPRFMGGWMRDAGRSALTGTVGLDATDKVVREVFDGRSEPQGPR